MRTPRGYASVILTILVLATSSYFGTKGQKSIFAPGTTRSQQRQPHGGENAKVPPEVEFKDTQVALPSNAPETPAVEPADTTPLPQRPKQANEVLVTRVIDGDTVELENGEKVRMIGVDTPESVDPRKPVECFAQEAKEFTKSLIDHQWVRLEKDVDPTDKYGRTLAYIWRDDVMVNDTLLKEGFAQLLTIPPNVKYVDQFKESERLARQQQKGLWGECK